VSKQSGQSIDSCSWLSVDGAAAFVGDFSKTTASCVSVARFNLFVFLYTNNKVYNTYHMTQFTIDTILSTLRSVTSIAYECKIVDLLPKLHIISLKRSFAFPEQSSYNKYSFGQQRQYRRNHGCPPGRRQTTQRDHHYIEHSRHLLLCCKFL